MEAVFNLLYLSVSFSVLRGFRNLLPIDILVIFQCFLKPHMPSRAGACRRSTRGYSFFFIKAKLATNIHKQIQTYIQIQEKYQYIYICMYTSVLIHALRTSFMLTVFFACWKFSWVDVVILTIINLYLRWQTIPIENYLKFQTPHK